MTAEAALEKQIERCRQMTGEEWLAAALDLHQMACDIAREGIRRQCPLADDAEAEQRLQSRLKLVHAT